jgi:mRNA interferase RelE/StbE
LNTRFSRSFEKDLRRLQDKYLRARILETIRQIQQAENLDEISQVKKLRGHEDYYRVRLGDYRLGLKLTGLDVTFMRLLHRKDIYRYFP